MLDWIATHDAALFLWINALPHPTALTTLMRVVSAAGSASTVWLLLAVGLAITRDPGAALRTVLTLAVVTLAIDGVLKPTAGRDRPPVRLETVQVHATGIPPTFSFPSGHAATAAAGAYALGRVWPPGPLWMLAMLIAISRVYLGVHYPLDVAAGLLVGVVGAVVVTGGTAARSTRNGGSGPEAAPSRSYPTR